MRCIEEKLTSESHQDLLVRDGTQLFLFPYGGSIMGDNFGDHRMAERLVSLCHDFIVIGVVPAWSFRNRLLNKVYVDVICPIARNSTINALATIGVRIMRVIHIGDELNVCAFANSPPVYSYQISKGGSILREEFSSI
jgi:hypothetical protein